MTAPGRRTRPQGEATARCATVCSLFGVDPEVPYVARWEPVLGRGPMSLVARTGGRRAYGSGSVIEQVGCVLWEVEGRRPSGQAQARAAPRARHARRADPPQAEARLRELLAEARRAGDPRAADLRRGGRALPPPRRAREQRKPSTVQDYRIIVRRHLAPVLRRHDARARSTPTSSPPTSPPSAARASRRRRSPTTSTSLHGIFAHAVKRGWAHDEPGRLRRPAAAPRADPDIRFLDREELEALLRAVPDDLLGPTDRVLYLTAAMTGLRQGELIALRWRDVDWTAGVVRVRRSYIARRVRHARRAAARAAPCRSPTALAAELERHSPRSRLPARRRPRLLPPAHRRPLRRLEDAQALQAARSRAPGCGRVRFHDLRHTFGTRMAAAGAPLRALQEWMGHRDYKTTRSTPTTRPTRRRGRCGPSAHSAR